ncbi:MAG TPA: hypothetical protein VMF67_08480 [Rhizomicrobium sp.]|nr:hypothetical protein [Rhizomicrobium sp.]
MRFLTLTVSAAALCGGVALGSLPAAADETGTLSDCTRLADQVNQALDANPQSANHEAAVKEKLYGRGFCTNGFYGLGAAHYEQALKLLGTNKS